MRVDDVELGHLSRKGDDEAEADLRLILSRAPTKQPPESYLADLPKQLGRWDPKHHVSKLDPAVAEYVQRPFELSTDELAVIERAQRAYTTKHGLRARLVLATYSLPIIYVHSESALTLAGTGRLLLHIRDRLEDTQNFIDGVMNPGSFGPDGPGHQWIRKVRLTHAVIRALHKGRPNSSSNTSLPELTRIRVFDAVKDEMPLDQVELGFVLQTFAWVIVDGLRRLGKPMSRAEAADHVEAWAVIGRMMGIEPKMRPTSVKNAKTLFLRIRDRAVEQVVPSGPTKDDPEDTWMAGPLLAAAWITMLVQIQRERTPPWLDRWLKCFPALDEALQQTSRVLIRQNCGIKASRRLRITRAPFIHWTICMIAVRMLDPERLAGDLPMSGAESSAAWM